MALRFLDGFEHWDPTHTLAKWTAVGNSPGFAAGRFGGRAAVLGVGSTLTKTFADSGGIPTWITGHARRDGGFQGGLTYKDTPTLSEVNLEHVGDGRVQFRTSHSGGTHIIPGVVINLNQWYYWGFKCAATRNGSNLDVILSFELDGFVVDTWSTSLLNVPTISGFATMLVNGAAALTSHIDDLYVYDASGSVNNALEGVVKIGAIYPDAEGSNLTWSPNSGTVHYDRVKERPTSFGDTSNPDDDLTYLQSNTPGDRETLNFEPTSETDIRAVQYLMLCRKDDAGEHQINAVYRQGTGGSSGTEVVGADDFITISSYIYHIKTYGKTNPVTLSPWTQTDINTGQWGMVLKN